MVWDNEDVFNTELVLYGATPEDRPTFLWPIPTSTPAPTPVDPEVECSPSSGEVTPSQVFTVTVLFNVAPTEVVLEVRSAPLEAALDEAPGRVVYATGEGFREGFMGSGLALSMAGKFWTFTVVSDNPWPTGALKFSVFASDSTGGSTA